jgi:uncharacterized protein with FMN-binding domain
MKRITFWLLSTVSVVVLLFGYDASNATSSTSTTPPAVVSGGVTDSGEASGATATPSTPATGSSGGGSTSTKKARRTVTGDVASTQWGPVQVELTVAAGKITKVAVPQYPDGNGRDYEINEYALPILVQETLQDQSADIDMVSGATVTSDGYVRSLQSALDRAGL